jgi:hypothetical protein
MDSTEIMTLWLWLKLRDFYRRHKVAIFLLLVIGGVAVVSIFLSQRKGEVSLKVGPEWNDWNPAR